METKLGEVSSNDCDARLGGGGAGDEDPDSTSQEKEWGRRPFTEGEDILVHDQDGLIYFGIVVEVDLDSGQCLVRFGDCTERWSSFYELRRLGDPEPSEPAATPPPTITPGAVSSPPKSKVEKLHEELKADYEELPAHVQESRSQLPYTFESLEWDAAHQRNEVEHYCYCGESGDWYRKMLQCKDCLQWFHQECIRSLNYQLLCGDRFFEFVCTLCNGKHEEYIRRLDLSFVDSIHLVIFNLILIKNQKFHDIETSILPFMKKKLKYLQGTCSNQSFKGNKIESESISKLLISNKSRFKCGSETGKKNSYWGLRKMCAPPLPSKYFPRGWGRWATGPKGDGKSCSLETYSKKNRKGLKDLSRNPRNPHLRRNQKRFKDLNGEHSDSDASSRGTLDFLIKPPKDFSGANNPFRSAVPATTELSAEVRGDSTPNSSLRRLLNSEKSSPVSSGAPSTITTDDSLVEEMLHGNLSLEAGDPIDEEEDEFKSPGIKLSDLKAPLSSYFAPSAKKRIERGDKFRVKARRLTLNGDIAYLIDWEAVTNESY